MSRDKDLAVKAGAKGIAIATAALRKASLDYLREGGHPSPALPVTLTCYPGGVIGITDGRHRIYLARQRGETSIHGTIRGMGPRGGITWSHTGKLPI